MQNHLHDAELQTSLAINGTAVYADKSSAYQISRDQIESASLKGRSRFGLGRGVLRAFYSRIMVLGILGMGLVGHSVQDAIADEPQVASATDIKWNSRLEGFEYPFPVKVYGFESQGQSLEMAYMDVTPNTPNGETIVLLHGKNFSGFYYERMANWLVAKGYRVVIIDQIGFGKSTKPAMFQYSLQALATYTRNLLQSLGIESHSLLGHSMGGMLATRYSLMYPDLVKKLYLVAPIGLEDWKTMTSYKSVDELMQMELAGTREKAKEYQRVAYYGGQWKPEYDQLLVPVTGWLNGPDKELVAWNAALTSEMLMTQPVYYEFQLLKPETVLITGERDRTAIGKNWAPPTVQKEMGDYPALGRKVASLIPNCRFIELKDMGHLPFLENETLFWELVGEEF